MLLYDPGTYVEVGNGDCFWDLQGKTPNRRRLGVRERIPSAWIFVLQVSSILEIF